MEDVLRRLIDEHIELTPRRVRRSRLCSRRSRRREALVI